MKYSPSYFPTTRIPETILGGNTALVTFSGPPDIYKILCFFIPDGLDSSVLLEALEEYKELPQKLKINLADQEVTTLKHLAVPHFGLWSSWFTQNCRFGRNDLEHIAKFLAQIGVIPVFSLPQEQFKPLRRGRRKS